jgi:hypothetical protein
MFRKKNPNDAKYRLEEEKLYGIAYSEIAQNEVKHGVWAKALVQAKGDESRAKAIYIELRIQSILDEITVEQAMHEKLKAIEEQERELAALDEQEIAQKISKEEFLASEWVTIDQYIYFNPKVDRAKLISLALKSRIETIKNEDGYMMIRPFLSL